MLEKYSKLTFIFYWKIKVIEKKYIWIVSNYKSGNIRAVRGLKNYNNLILISVFLI